MDNRELKALYEKAKEAYYNGEAIMTDYEFDELEKQLGLENKSYVGARHNPSYTIKHPYAMGSLSKVQIKKGSDGTVDWADYLQKVNKFVKNNALIITPKYDGCSFEAIIDGAEVVSISSRGDGEYGKDLYKHLINNVKLNAKKIASQLHGGIATLRGEVLIDKTIFEQKYSEFVNPRSFVSGVLNREYSDDKEFTQMLDDLSIVIYEVKYLTDGGWQDTDWTSFDYLNMPDFYYENLTVSSENILSEIYSAFESYREKCAFALDGIVLKPVVALRDNNLSEHRPSDCVAVKFIPMLQETVVEEIIWSSKKTDELIPVIKVKPVTMDGKQVSRASAHNYGYLIDNKISVGTKVVLSLAGDIIPFIYKVTDTSAFSEDGLMLPEYGTYVEGCHLFAYLSPDEVRHKWFVNSAAALNIPGLGSANAEKLYDYLYSYYGAAAKCFAVDPIQTPDNILLISPRDIEVALGGKTGKATADAFEKVLKDITLKEVISSLSIEDCGPKVAEQIEKYLLGMDADFSHLASKAYAWVYSKTSSEYVRLMKVLDNLHKDLGDCKEAAISKEESKSGQIPVILTGEPNEYASKGEFLKCNPQYRQTGSWKECQIVFTNSLESNTGKMKQARAKGIEIRLY